MAKNQKTNDQATAQAVDLNTMVRPIIHTVGDTIKVKENNKIGVIKKIYENGILQIRMNENYDFICGGGAVINLELV
jgi:predicted transcriptional regulator YheO